MNVRDSCESRSVQSRSESWVFSQDPTSLAMIRERSIDCVVFERELDATLLSALDSEARERSLPRVAAGVSAGDSRALGDSIAPLLLHCSASTRGAIASDIEWIARAVASLAEVDRVRVAFGSIVGDECTKFHQDFVRLRAIVTYAGPGTVVAERSAVDPRALDDPPEDVARCNASVVTDARMVRSARRGAVVLLKGAALAPGAFGAVHRSPTLARDGQRRIVLTVTATARGDDEQLIEARTSSGQRVFVYPDSEY